MEDREPPSPAEQQAIQDATAPTLDPSVYSLGPNASIPEESFDESEDVRRWDGGSTDFTFADDDDPPLAKLELPPPENVVSDED